MSDITRLAASFVAKRTAWAKLQPRNLQHQPQHLPTSHSPLLPCIKLGVSWLDQLSGTHPEHRLATQHCNLWVWVCVCVRKHTVCTYTARQ